MTLTPKIITSFPDFQINQDILQKRIDYCKKRTNPLSTKEITSSLSSWHKKINIPSSAEDSLKILLKPDSFCSVTGQQSGLLGNPVLSIYKLISNELLAEKIATRFNCTVVPVFWLQTEDHDLKEISSFGFVSEELKLVTFESISDQEQLENNRISTGFHNIPDSTSADIITFIKTVCDSEKFSVLESLISACIKDNSTYAECFARCMYYLFPKSRTVFINPGLSCFNETRSKLMLRVFKDWKDINQDLKETSRELNKDDLSAPVFVRENSPLFFYHPEGEEKGRYRIEFNGTSFEIPEISKTYSDQEIEDHILSRPLQFSTSALLRPLFQDTLLPSLSYTGGPAELNYLRQVAPLYERLEVPMPAVIPRAHAVVLDQKLFTQTENLLSSPELLLDSDMDKIKLHVQDTILQTKLRAKDISEKINPLLKQVFMTLSEQAKAVDQTLEKPLQKTIQNTESNIQKFLEKFDSAVLRNDDTTMSRVQKLLSITHPDAIIQERAISPVWLYSRYGNHVFEMIYESIKESLNRKNL